MNNSENQPKQQSQAEHLKNEARDEALSAAEKGLQAAREALEAAERKLAEAQAYARAQEQASQVQAREPEQVSQVQAREPEQVSSQPHASAHAQGEPPVAPPVGYTAQPATAPAVEQTYEQPVSQPFGQGAQPYYEAVPQQPTQDTYIPNWTQPSSEPFPQGAPQQPAGFDQQNQQYGQGGYSQDNVADAQQSYGYTQPSSTQPHYSTPYAASKDHVAAGLLAIFLGGFGIHKFYLGYNTQGFIMLAITVLAGVLTIGLASAVMWLIAIIEGIIYLSKNQGDFERIYVYGKHEWF